jgi:asparagine synthase (glutamine-hydrolysing)
MPGIVGLITKIPREQAEPQLLRMLATLRHESFYGTGTWIDEPLGVYVGWSVRQNSFSDAMPLCNERGNVVLVFSGEEYPEPEVARRLREKGHTLQTEGPSYLVHLYEEDPSFPAGLNGRFHGLLTDRLRRTATLFNDRYGMHRLYYHRSNDAVYFAAEAKAILEVRPELRSADPRGLGELVSCGCVLDNRTVFKDIHVLPPASAWVFRNSSIESKGTYFRSQEWEDQAPLDPEPYYEEILKIFSRNLPRYFNGHQPIAMSVTGGLDTRMILAWHKLTPGSLPCYTFGGMFRDCRDVTVARQVTRVCQQPHEVIRVGEEFLSRFPHYAERSVYLTDACVDVSRSPDLYAQERAREIAPVRIVGTFGSEVFRPVRPRSRDGRRWAVAFKPEPPTPGLFHPDVLSAVQAAGDTYTGLLRGHPVSFSVFRQAPWYHYGVLALEQTQLTVRSPYLDNDLVRTAFRAPESALAGNDVSLRLIGDGNPALLRIRTDRGLAGASGRLSAAAFRHFEEFTFKAEYASDYGMTQSMARVDHLLSRLHLERLFLGRHKFHHFRVWYRDALSRYVREMLLDPRTLSRPYLQRKGLEAVVEGHLKGDRNYTTEIHKVLTLELMHRLFLDPR